MAASSLLVLLASMLLAKASALAIRETQVVKGRVVVSDLPTRAREAKVYIQTSTGQTLHAFCDKDGWFTFYHVPPGSHMLNADLVGYIFPEVRVDMSSKNGLIRAAYAFNKQQTLSSPLVLVPAAVAQYYEKRKPFDVWSFVKSPYGIMICISVFAIFVFPKMKVDPEEYKQLQTELASARRDVAAEDAARARRS